MKPAGRDAGAPRVKEIGNFDELQAICDAPIYCEFKIDGQEIRLPCRRLSPAVDEQVRALRREATPPFVKERGEYNYFDAAFLKKKDEGEQLVRSLVIYAGCPSVAAKNPGLTNRDDIHRFVKNLLTENILELIKLTILAGGVELTERTNFTSTAASES